MDDYSIRLHARLDNAYTYPEPYESQYQDLLRATSSEQIRSIRYRSRREPRPFTEFIISGFGTEHPIWKQIPEQPTSIDDGYRCGLAAAPPFFFELDSGGTGPVVVDRTKLTLFSAGGNVLIAALEIRDSQRLEPDELSERPNFSLYSGSNLPDRYDTRQLRQAPFFGWFKLLREE